MTEDQIEREVERKMDRLDTQLMGGVISQSYYDEAVRVLDKWAQQQVDHVQGYDK